MSKIFEALKKTTGEVADLTLPMMTAQPGEPDTGTVPEQGDLARSSMTTAADVSAITGIPDSPDLGTPQAASSKGEPSGGRQGVVSLRLAAESPILPFDAAHSRAGEQYRMARTKIMQDPRQPRLIAISSAGSGDGKTITSINLAGAMALKSEARVLLVDADLRRSQIAGLLGIPPAPGLGDVLGGTSTLDESIMQVKEFPNLFVLPGGKPIDNPTELLDSSRWTSLCTQVRRQFKFVVFDVPPMGTVADYDLIQAHCDGVVVVVRPDHTDREMCLKALDSIPKERLLGVVMNCVQDWFLWKTADRYYYAAS